MISGPFVSDWFLFVPPVLQGYGILLFALLCSILFCIHVDVESHLFHYSKSFFEQMQSWRPIENFYPPFFCWLVLPETIICLYIFCQMSSRSFFFPVRFSRFCFPFLGPLLIFFIVSICIAVSWTKQQKKRRRRRNRNWNKHRLCWGERGW